MKSYPKYKPSKIVWYPEIPENWDYCKVKHIANTYAGGTPSTVVDSFWHNGDIPWLPSGKLQNCEITSAEKFITQEGLNGSSTKWIKPNTVLVALTGATCANIGYLTFKACANQSVIAVDENPEKANSRFLYYMFLNMRSQILTHQTGGAQAGINDSDVKNLYLLKPSLEEQTKIAAFLDYKTNIIDATIDKKKRLIELLKEKRQAVINEAVTKGLNPNVPMKDSGVEWLGEIPEHWKVTFLKRYCDKITDGAHFSPKTEFEGKNYISVKDVDEFGNIDLVNCKKINIEDFIDLQKNGCQPNFNDVLLTKDGTIGRAAVVKKSNDFVTLSSLGLITPNQNKLNSDFLRYYLVSEININQMFSMIAGAALTRLTIDKIKHLIITIPLYDEQLSIVNFLEKEISKYDTLIKVNDNQIERLKTYRQSLISEAVTGKIDVRDWQNPQNN